MDSLDEKESTFFHFSVKKEMWVCVLAWDSVCVCVCVCERERERERDREKNGISKTRQFVQTDFEVCQSEKEPISHQMFVLAPDFLQNVFFFRCNHNK